MISKWDVFAVAPLVKYTHIFAHLIIVLMLLYSKEIARTLSDISVVELFFFARWTPLCFEYLLMAETALGLILTFLLFIYSSYFSSRLSGKNETRNYFSNALSLHILQCSM